MPKLKRPLSEAQIQQRRNAGNALKEQRGLGYYSEIAKQGGGRPTFMESVRRANEREEALRKLNRPGRPRK